MGVVVERQDIEAALEARRELGPEYEPQIIDAIVERIEKRLDERLDHQGAPERRRSDLRLPIGSIALGIPVTAVALSDARGVGGIVVAVVAWIAIAAVNVAAALAHVVGSFAAPRRR